jgi:hypothetical protein
MMFVMTDEQGQQDVDISQTLLHRSAPVSEAPCAEH